MLLEARDDFEVIKSDQFETYDIGIKSPQVLFDILCDRTYSDPLVTMVQEYMSNARDAHREIGKQDIPIEVTLPTYLDSHIYITDYGPGLSPQRMRDVFVFLGESTKRDSNDQHGGFGIGAKIGFAYTDTFHIVSRHYGIETEYIAYKGPDRIGHIDKLSEKDTEAPDGVTIQLPINESDFTKVARAVFKCCYFWRIQPKIYNIPEEYENIQLKNWTDLPPKKMLSMDSQTRSDVYRNILDIHEKPLVIVDRIIYGPLKESQAYQYNKLVGHVGIFVDTGEVTVAVNRENLQYNDATNERLSTIIKSNLSVSRDRAISHIINSPEYDLVGMAKHLAETDTDVVTKVEFDLNWAYYDIFYCPTSKTPLWLKIPNDWTIYTATRPFWGTRETLEESELTRYYSSTKGSKYLPINIRYHYILDDRDTKAPSRLLSFRWIQSKDKVDGEKFFILRHNDRVEKTDEWIFQVARELTLDMLSSYQKQRIRTPGVRAKYRVFHMLAPSSEVEKFDLVVEKNEDKIFVINTKRKNDKELRNRVKNHLDYITVVTGKSRNDYKFFVFSNNRAYKRFVKRPNFIDVYEWLESMNKNVRNYNYHNYQRELACVHEIRRLRGLMDLFGHQRLPDRRYGFSRVIDGLVRIHKELDVQDPKLCELVDYAYYNELFVHGTKSHMSAVPLTTESKTKIHRRRRWQTYLSNFVPELSSGSRSSNDVQYALHSYKILLFALINNAKFELIAEIVDYINTKYILSNGGLKNEL